MGPLIRIISRRLLPGLTGIALAWGCQQHLVVSPLISHPMFTLEQIRHAHAKVKTGADFPQYIQEIKQLGVHHYDYYVADGHSEYVSSDGTTLASAPMGMPRSVAGQGLPDRVEWAIHIHQQGQTDYATFCQQVATAGVEKWTVNTVAMTCTYYDQQGKVLVEEPIPLP